MRPGDRRGGRRLEGHRGPVPVAIHIPKPSPLPLHRLRPEDPASWPRPWLAEVEELMAGPERLDRAAAVARVEDKMRAYIEDLEERAAIREADGEHRETGPPRPSVAEQMREWKRERDRRKGVFTFSDGASRG